MSKEKRERKIEKSQSSEGAWVNEKDEPARHESIYQIVEYQMWLAERHESSNKTLSMRATTILGLLGLDVAIFDVVSPRLFTHEFAIAIIGGITDVFFLTATGLLFCTSR